MLKKKSHTGGFQMSAYPSMRRAATMLSAAAISFLMAFLLLAAGSFAARADDTKVLASVALKATLTDLTAKYESTGGGKVAVDYGVAAQLKQRILDGEATDVAILIRAMMEDLLKQGKLSGDIVNVGGTPVAIAIRAGAPKPDIGSVEALKRTLLAAKSISYSDPAKGGASGVAFAKVVDQLGLTEQLKAKTILVPGAQAPDLVAKGEAELGVAQASEILPVSGVELLGPLPAPLGSVTLFAAGISAGSKSPDAAKALIKFLTSPDAAPVLRAKGFGPG
jgi:molybdate transport system substrate-binding protein